MSAPETIATAQPLQTLRRAFGMPEIPPPPPPATIEEAWQRLTEEERAEALHLAPVYLEICRRHYRPPFLLRYLAQKSWTLLPPGDNEIGFSEILALYPANMVRQSSTKDCRAAWAGLTPEERRAAIDGVPWLLKAMKEDGRSHGPHLARYLIDKRWTLSGPTRQGQPRSVRPDHPFGETGGQT